MDGSAGDPRLLVREDVLVGGFHLHEAALEVVGVGNVRGEDLQLGAARLRPVGRVQGRQLRRKLVREARAAFGEVLAVERHFE